MSSVIEVVVTPPVAVGVEAPTVISVDIGDKAGPRGATGPAGEGVPTGGTTGQVLAKTSDADFDTEWIVQTGGGGTPTLYPFSSPAATWTVTHSLGRYPQLELLDAAGAVFDADVEFPDLNTAVVTHAQPTSGSVLIS